MSPSHLCNRLKKSFYHRWSFTTMEMIVPTFWKAIWQLTLKACKWPYPLTEQFCCAVCEFLLKKQSWMCANIYLKDIHCIIVNNSYNKYKIQMHKIGVWLSKLWQTHVMKLISRRKACCKRAFNKYRMLDYKESDKSKLHSITSELLKNTTRKSKRDQVD